MWLLPFYRGGTLDLNPLAPSLLLGIVWLGARVFDSIADPVVANLSDNCRSILGRRIPFLRWNALPMVLTMIMLFFPPTGDKGYLNLVYFGFMASLFYITFTAYSAPYLALLPELVKDQKERVKLSTQQAIFSLAGTAIGMVISPMLVDAVGFRGMAVILGAISLIVLSIPAFTVSEPINVKESMPGSDILASFLATFRNRRFVCYLVANLSFWFGFNIVRSSASDYVTVLMGYSDASAASLYIGITFVVTVLALPLVSYIARRYGNRTAMIGFMSFDALILPLLALIGLPWTGIDAKILGAVIMALIGVPLAGLFVVPNAVVAEITDDDECRTGVRREAMFFGAQGFFSTVSLGLSALVILFIEHLFHLELGIRFTGLIAGGFALVGALIMIGYPKDRTNGLQP